MNRPWFRYILMVLTAILFSLVLAHDDERPPFSVPDPAINENFRRAYELIDQHKHDGIDSSYLTIAQSSASYGQFDGFALWFGSATLTANTSLNVAPLTVGLLFLPQAWVLNSASYTLRVDDWVSSFTITNTGNLTQRVAWMALGK